MAAARCQRNNGQYLRKLIGSTSKLEDCCSIFNMDRYLSHPVASNDPSLLDEEESKRKLECRTSLDTSDHGLDVVPNEKRSTLTAELNDDTHQATSNMPQNQSSEYYSSSSLPAEDESSLVSTLERKIKDINHLFKIIMGKINGSEENKAYSMASWNCSSAPVFQRNTFKRCI